MERKTRFRVGVLLLLTAALLGMFTVRLFKLQSSAAAAEKADQSASYTYETVVPAARGSILDRSGKVLVTNRASYNIQLVGYVLFNAPDPDANLLRLAELCAKRGISYADHLPISSTRPYTSTLDSLNDTWQGYFKDFLAYEKWDPDISPQNLIKLMKRLWNIPSGWTEEQARMVIGLRYELALRYAVKSLGPYELISDVSADDLSALMELNTPGLTVETGTVRVYDTTYAAHILGRVGLMNPEEYAKYKDQGYAMDAKVGKDGLEQAFENYLHGTDGVRVTTVSKNGEILDQHYSKLPQAGDNVVLSVDIDLQTAAENALRDVILDLRKNGVGLKDEGKDAEGGALVAIDVKTGEVLASASYPTFNLADYSKDFDKLKVDKLSPLFNRALSQTYPPGSIYKMVTAIAAVDKAKIGPFYEIEDKGIYKYYDNYQPKCLIYTNYGTTHGIINMMQALEVSCNYYFYEIGRLTGISSIDEVAKGLGLGEATGVELPEELGYRANPETKAKLFKDDPTQSGWYGADTLMAAIGQSENKFTPLQMADYVATLANRGTRYKATFLRRVLSSDYTELVEEHKPTVLSSYHISDDALNCVEQGMRMAVTEPGGTASKYLKDYPVAVCAKTGTAQHSDNGSAGSDNASFVCYAPADNPQIAIAVYVEKGAQGGNLAKAAVAVMDEYFRSESAESVPQENAAG
jgi:penicillin-binding protein 2